MWEAAVLASAGFDDIFVVNTVSHPAKIRLLAELAADRRILVAVDEADHAAALSAAAGGGRAPPRVMGEGGPGLDRGRGGTPRPPGAPGPAGAGAPRPG